MHLIYEGTDPPSMHDFKLFVLDIEVGIQWSLQTIFSLLPHNHNVEAISNGGEGKKRERPCGLCIF